MVLRKQDGQTVVEYILLLAVAVSLVMTFYNSDTYRKLFGNQGSIGKAMKDETEFSYRHAYGKNGSPADLPPYQGNNHPSYFNQESGQTRFFGPKDNYP
jgi:Flp pilus assembly pilin Flp